MSLTLPNHPSTKISVLSYIFTLSLVLVPFYSFKSGGLQFVDIPVVLIVLYTLFTNRKQEIEYIKRPLIAFSTFLIFAIVVNVFHYIDTTDLFYIQASLWLIYAFFLFFSCIILFYRLLNNSYFLKCFYFGLLISTFVPLLFIYTARSEPILRYNLSFNNPNQLALFAVLVWAMILALNNYYQKNIESLQLNKLLRRITLICFCLSHCFVVLSASRAGFISIILLDFMSLSFFKKNTRILLIIFLVVLSPLLILRSNGNDSTNLFLFERLKGHDFSNILRQRINRLSELNDFSLIIGKGKSGTEEANTAIGETKKLEVHNTIFDIMFSYGLVGVCLFAWFLIAYFRVAFLNKFNCLILISLLPFHLSHNLIRFRLLWILYALLYCISQIQFYKIDKRGKTYENSCPQA